METFDPGRTEPLPMTALLLGEVLFQAPSGLIFD